MLLMLKEHVNILIVLESITLSCLSGEVLINLNVHDE